MRVNDEPSSSSDASKASHESGSEEIVVVLHKFADTLVPLRQVETGFT